MLLLKGVDPVQTSQMTSICPCKHTLLHYTRKGLRDYLPTLSEISFHSLNHLPKVSEPGNFLIQWLGLQAKARTKIL